MRFGFSLTVGLVPVVALLGSCAAAVEDETADSERYLAETVSLLCQYESIRGGGSESFQIIDDKEILTRGSSDEQWRWVCGPDPMGLEVTMCDGRVEDTEISFVRNFTAKDGSTVHEITIINRLDGSYEKMTSYAGETTRYDGKCIKSDQRAF